MPAAPFVLERVPHPGRVRSAPDREQRGARGLRPCRVAHLQRRRRGRVVAEHHDRRVFRREQRGDRIGAVARQVEASPPTWLHRRADHAAVDIGRAPLLDDHRDVACGRRHDRVRVDVHAGELRVGHDPRDVTRGAGRAQRHDHVGVARERGDVRQSRRSAAIARDARRVAPALARVAHVDTGPSQRGTDRRAHRTRVQQTDDAGVAHGPEATPIRACGYSPRRAGRALRAVVDTGHDAGVAARARRGGRGAGLPLGVGAGARHRLRP